VAITQSIIGIIANTFSHQSPQIFNMKSVFDALQGYLGSTYINLFNKLNQSFQVYAHADAHYRLDIEDMTNLYVRNENKEMVPLGTLMKVSQRLGTELVTHYNLYPSARFIGMRG
jgi:HAE1 family hydrophobic/amphiphilic exporter-1